MGKGCTQVYKYTSVYRGSVELFNLEISVQKHCILIPSQSRCPPCFHAAADVTYAMCVSSKVTTVQRGFLLMRFIKLRSSIIKDVRCMLCCVVIKTCHPPTQHNTSKVFTRLSKPLGLPCRIETRQFFQWRLAVHAHIIFFAQGVRGPCTDIPPP